MFERFINFLGNIARTVQGGPWLPPPDQRAAAPSPTPNLVDPNALEHAAYQGQPDQATPTPVAPKNIPVSAPPPLNLMPSPAPSSPLPPPGAFQTPRPQQARLTDPWQTFLGNITSQKDPAAPPASIPTDLRQGVENASKNTGVPPAILYGLAQNERYQLDNGDETGGLGRGYFQIDLGQNPTITNDQAHDPMFAANFAAHRLLNNLHHFQSVGNQDPVSSAIIGYNAGLNPANWNNPITAKYLPRYIHDMQSYTYPTNQ